MVFVCMQWCMFQELVITCGCMARLYLSVVGSCICVVVVVLVVIAVIYSQRKSSIRIYLEGYNSRKP